MTTIYLYLYFEIKINKEKEITLTDLMTEIAPKARLAIPS